MFKFTSAQHETRGVRYAKWAKAAAAQGSAALAAEWAAKSKAEFAMAQEMREAHCQESLGMSWERMMST